LYSIFDLTSFQIAIRLTQPGVKSKSGALHVKMDMSMSSFSAPKRSAPANMEKWLGSKNEDGTTHNKIEDTTSRIKHTKEDAPFV